MNIDWKRKLSSRKFWAAVVAFITPILVIFNVPDISIEQIAAVITACGGLVTYILVEGNIDSKAIEDKDKE